MLRATLIRFAPIAVVAFVCSCSCESTDGPESVVTVTFGERCGNADGCDLDLSCLGAISIRAWTPAGGLQAKCLRGADLAGIERGCDLDALDVRLALDVEDGPMAVELLGLAGDDCAPVEDAPTRILFEGIASVATVGQPLEIDLACGAGCDAGEDACADADSCDCCAGVCVDDDAMLHCGGCFVVCDPFRADRCDEDVCHCGTGPPCAEGETCCPDGTCAAVGTCAPTSCPFFSDDTCTNPATDVDACGGGIGSDSCSSDRADACFAGGCSCGGGPACPSAEVCREGRCE